MSPTLTGDHENRITDYTAIACYTAKRYAESSEDLPTLRASGADIGGGSEGIILLGNRQPSDGQQNAGNIRSLSDYSGSSCEGRM